MRETGNIKRFLFLRFMFHNEVVRVKGGSEEEHATIVNKINGINKRSTVTSFPLPLNVVCLISLTTAKLS